MPKGAFQDCCCQWPLPCGKPLLIHASTGDPPILAGGFGWVFCEVTAPFLMVLVHRRFCLYSPRLETLFPSVLWKSYNQIPLAFKVRFPGNSQSLCWIPRLGILTWGSEPLQQWENSFCIIVLQFVGHQPGRYRIWFLLWLCSSYCSLRLLLCLWMWDVFLWWVPASSCQWLFNS